MGDISVEAGITLTVLPSTTFIFDGPYAFTVGGTLLTEGTEEDSVIFTCDPELTRWGGLRFIGGACSDSRLAYCLIEYGSADVGGGIFCDDIVFPTFTHCTIINSSATDGGGVYCDAGSHPSFANCIIRDNLADDGGGGMYCLGGSSPSFTDCAVNSNDAVDGGGVYCEGSSPIFMESAIDSNEAEDEGGGVYCTMGGPIFTKSTLSHNMAGNDQDSEGDEAGDSGATIAGRFSPIVF